MANSNVQKQDDYDFEIQTALPEKKVKKGKGKDHFLDQVQWLRMKNRVKVHNAIMDT